MSRNLKNMFLHNVRSVHEAYWWRIASQQYLGPHEPIKRWVWDENKELALSGLDSATATSDKWNSLTTEEEKLAFLAEYNHTDPEFLDYCREMHSLFEGSELPHHLRPFVKGYLHVLTPYAIGGASRDKQEPLSLHRAGCLIRRAVDRAREEFSKRHAEFVTSSNPVEEGLKYFGPPQRGIVDVIF